MPCFYVWLCICLLYVKVLHADTDESARSHFRGWGCMYYVTPPSYSSLIIGLYLLALFGTYSATDTDRFDKDWRSSAPDKRHSPLVSVHASGIFSLTHSQTRTHIRTHKHTHTLTRTQLRLAPKLATPIWKSRIPTCSRTGTNARTRTYAHNVAHTHRARARAHSNKYAHILASMHMHTF